MLEQKLASYKQTPWKYSTCPPGWPPHPEERFALCSTKPQATRGRRPAISGVPRNYCCPPGLTPQLDRTSHLTTSPATFPALANSLQVALQFLTTKVKNRKPPFPAHRSCCRSEQHFHVKATSEPAFTGSARGADSSSKAGGTGGRSKILSTDFRRVGRLNGSTSGLPAIFVFSR